MIRAVFERKDGRLGVTIDGHAQFHPGNDIVCAGCSALAYALMGYLVNAVPPERLEAEVRNGYMRLGGPEEDEMRTVFRMAEIGLRQIAETYPECVEVN